MDTLVNQLARELSEAISAAISGDTRVDACREKARAAGLEMKVSLEAAIGFSPREGGPVARTLARKATQKSTFDMSANDRRFLKSLRIAADEAATKPEKKEVE
jgi:hypothetical protein